MDLWTQWGKERVGHIKRVALKYMHCLVQNRYSRKALHNTGSSARCCVTTQRG